MVDGWSVCIVARKEDTGKDTYYVNKEHKRFRSKPEVARFLGLETRSLQSSQLVGCPVPEQAPPAPLRGRLVRLPEKSDDRVGKRIKVAFSGEWWTATVIEAVAALHDSGTTKYVLRFDRDV